MSNLIKTVRIVAATALAAAAISELVLEAKRRRKEKVVTEVQ